VISLPNCRLNTAVESVLRYPGRKPLSNRQALCAILFVLKTGLPWEHLPRELGWGSGMTAWRRLHAWQKAGVWKRIHEALLETELAVFGLCLRSFDTCTIWHNVSIHSCRRDSSIRNALDAEWFNRAGHDQNWLGVGRYQAG
jgi:transposase